MLRRSRHPGPKLGAGQLATAWQVVSLLLEYPTEELLGRRPLLADAVAGLPAPVREPVSRFLTTLETAPLGQLQRDYVETFDVTRRCCLYLTYFAHGDTRKRGLALVQFKQAYRKAGWSSRLLSSPTTSASSSSSAPRTTPRRRGGCSTTTVPVSRCCESPWRRRAPRGTT